MPTFDETMDQVRELLQHRGRLSYRALKRRFELDDEYLEDLKEELIKAERVAVDEDGAVLVWVGGGAAPTPSAQRPAPLSQPVPLDDPSLHPQTIQSPPQSLHHPQCHSMILLFILKQARKPTAASSPSCSVTWSARPRCPLNSIPKTIGTSCKLIRRCVDKR